MNRILQSLAASDDTKEFDSPADEDGRALGGDYTVDFARFEANGGYAPDDDEPSLAFFSPLHYEENYAYPLVVWLHDLGGDERQLKRVMPLVSMRNYAAVAPRGVEAADSLNGFRWPQSERHIALAERRVEEALFAAEDRFHVAASRIFLAGLGEGGTMALRVALGNPLRYAGAISLGGAFPHGQRPLRNINAARRLPILVATGRDSVRYRESQVCRDLRLFHAAGLSVNLRQYPCGDELTTVMLSDMDRWMMEVICPTHSTANADC